MLPGDIVRAREGSYSEEGVFVAVVSVVKTSACTAIYVMGHNFVGWTEVSMYSPDGKTWIWNPQDDEQEEYIALVKSAKMEAERSIYQAYLASK